MDGNTETGSMKRAGFSLSQETITVLTVGVALAGIMFVGLGDMRAEGRADRARTEAALAEMRAEGRAFREAFAKQILRLVEQQGTLSGYVDGLDRAIASSGDRE